MLELSSPGLLFDKQKIFRIHPNVEKISTEQQCRILIVFDSNPELSKPLRDMTDKLIGACKFKSSEAVYLNVHTEKEVSIIQLQSKYSPEVTLVFGNINVSAQTEPVQKNIPYELNRTKVLHAEKLETLNADKNEKAALWAALQKMLNL